MGFGAITLENSFRVSTEVEYMPTYNLTILVLVIYIAQMSAYFHQKTCTRIFIAVLFITSN